MLWLYSRKNIVSDILAGSLTYVWVVYNFVKVWALIKESWFRNGTRWLECVKTCMWKTLHKQVSKQGLQRMYKNSFFFFKFNYYNTLFLGSLVPRVTLSSNSKHWEIISRIVRPLRFPAGCIHHWPGTAQLIEYSRVLGGLICLREAILKIPHTGDKESLDRCG